MASQIISRFGRQAASAANLLGRSVLPITVGALFAFVATGVAADLGAVGDGLWHSDATWTNGYPDLFDNAYIGSTYPTGAAANATVTVDSFVEVNAVYLGFGSGAAGTLDLGGSSLWTNILYLGENGGSGTILHTGGGTLVVAPLEVQGYPNNAGTIYDYGGNLSFAAGDICFNLELFNNATATTAAVGNVSNYVAVGSGATLTLGADLDLSFNGAVAVSGTLNANGHAITAGIVNLGDYGGGPFMLTNRGPINANTLLVSSQYSPAQTTFNMTAADSVVELDLYGVSTCLPAGAAVQRLNLYSNGASPPTYAISTTSAAGNITGSVSVDPGCTLNLGADLTASLDLSGTLNANGHAITGGTITLGSGGPFTLTNRGAITADYLSISSQYSPNQTAFNLTAADAVTNLALSGVSTNSLGGASLQSLTLGSNAMGRGSVASAYSMATTTAAGNVTNNVTVGHGCTLNLGADLVLTNFLDMEGTLNANGHALSAPTVYFGYNGGPATLVNDGLVTAGGWLQGSGSQAQFCAPGDALGFLTLENGSVLSIRDAAGQTTGTSLTGSSMFAISIDPTSSLNFEVNGLGSGWVFRWADLVGSDHIADLQALINTGEISFSYLNGGSYSLTADSSYTYVNVISVPEPPSLFLAGLVGLASLGALNSETIAMNHTPSRPQFSWPAASERMRSTRMIRRAILGAVLVIAVAWANPASAQIYNDETGQVIPGTQGITPGPGVDLSGWNTAGHQLEFAELAGINLAYASFAASDVASASFQNATLANANFTNAKLTSANFQGSNLAYAIFTNANLTNASFYASGLSNANLSGAIVKGANLQSSVGFTLTQLYSTASYASGDLTGVVLDGNDLTGGNFTNQNLSGASFLASTLTTAAFNNANLTNASLVGSSANNVNFTNANLANANLSYSTLTNANFTNATLTNANLATASNASLAGATLTNASFRGAVIKGANLGYTGFTLIQLYSTASYAGGDLTGVVLDGNDLTGGNFTNQNLSGASFLASTLTTAAFNNANLTNARLASTIVINLNFSGAVIKGANLGYTGFALTQLYSTASYAGGDLTGVVLDGNDLTGGNFANQNVGSASLQYSPLANANFSNANLTNSKVSGATLTNANFSNANLTGATVAGADFGNTTSTGFTASQLYSTASYGSGDLTGVGLEGNDLTGWNFANQNLTSADFTNANLTGANVKGANLSRATGFTASQFYSTASYASGDLTGIGLGGNNLTGWNFANQNLTNANFQNNYGPFTTNLTNANFSYANLTNANFQGVSYAPTTLTNANFSGAVIKGANFNNTTVTGFTANQLYSTASYTSGDLTGIVLAANDLAGWKFANQNLNNANFQNSTLTNANFSYANLTNANFQGVSYAPTTLTNANFSGAIVKGANFGYTTGFTANQLYSTASYSSGDLTGIVLQGDDLTGTTFANQNLTNANFQISTLTNVNFTGAIIKGVNFDSSTGFTANQLYSTASYARGDLTGIGLESMDLTGWSFVNQNLTNANFLFPYLRNANFTNANLTNANFGGTGYGSTVESANFTNANLTNARFIGDYYAFVDVKYANFSGAIVKGAEFEETNLTRDQLYSTASYISGDLTGVSFQGDTLDQWNFANQNLTNANFRATLGGDNFSGANLTNARFSTVGILNFNNFTDADLRGATGWSLSPGRVRTTITHNTIRPDGSIQGLALLAGEKLVVRNNPIAITVTTSATFDPASTLQLLLDHNWTSTVQFGTGLTPALAGTLDLEIAAGVDPASLAGNPIQLFNWNGPLAADNRFSAIATEPGFSFDLSNLYSNGTITVAAVSGSWNSNGSGNYSDAGKWSSVIPNGTGASVTFGAGVTAEISVPVLAATIDAAVTTGTLNFNSGGTNYLLMGDGVTGHGLVLNNNGVGAVVNVTAGNHAIYAPLTLADAGGTTFTVASGSTLTLGGPLTVTGAASPSIAINSSGTLAVTTPPTLPANTQILVNAGVLRFAATSGSENIGSGVTVTVASAATLELAGSVSALSLAVNITNNSTQAELGGIIVRGRNQIVGAIDGSGTTQVSAGSDLTANRIIQNALIIGGAAGNPGLVTIDASDASGNPLGQSSGLSLASSLMPSDSIGEGVVRSANLSSVAADCADLAVPAARNSVGIGNTSQVPEPSSLGLGLLALAALPLLAARRKRVS